MSNLKEFGLIFLLGIVLNFVSVGKAQLANSIVDLFTFGLDAADLISEEILPADLPPQNGTYDFIIVGAGPAGCVLANRLSENPNWTVYLLEAGGKENIVHDIPALAPVLQLTNSNWDYKSVPQENSCKGMNDNVCALPRGKVEGGTSSINFMIYNRGNKRDFDGWAEAGNIEWSYDDLLPYFKRSENANSKGLKNSPYHNTTGPLSVEYVSYRTTIVDAYVKGAQQAGHKLNDYNGKSQLGVSYVQATTKNGHRHSASKAYLTPIRDKRKNLHILTSALVTKVLIDPETKSAYGVEFLHRDKKRTIRARKEVILSAGAFNSPKLLMLSGIGPKAVLEPIGIPLIEELPVGEVMYDHMSFVGPVVTVNTSQQTLFANRLTPSDFIKYQLGSPSTRFSTIGAVEALTFIKTPNSKAPADLPDIELIMVSTSFAGDFGTALKGGANLRDDVYEKVFKPLVGRDHFAFLVMLFHPESYGYLTLQNSDPKSPPTIDPNYFKNPIDVEVILEGIKEAMRIINTPAMQSINATLHSILVPGCENFTFATDDYWRCAIKVLSYTLHHQVATCKMGTYDDPTSVVSPQLKVHGIRKLRVADTSIVPSAPTCHLNPISFVIGEKASDMIKDEWK